MPTAVSAEQNFEMRAGDTRRLLITVLDQATGLPLNISAATFKWSFAKNVRGTQIVLKTLGSGVEIINGPNGQLRVTINPSDTEGRHGRHYHELEMTEADGSITTVLSGWMDIGRTLIPSV